MEREKEAMVATHDEEVGPKVRRGLPTAKRSNLFKPVPAWKLEEDVDVAGPFAVAADGGDKDPKQHRPRQARRSFVGSGGGVSARKLGANLWETQEMPRFRMGRRASREPRHREEGLVGLSDLSPVGPHEVTQHAGDLGKHVTASVVQHLKPTERNAHSLQPVSPASYNGSLEVVAHNQAITPTSSLDLKCSRGYGLKTSMELLRVLNRIWSLEEQHAWSVSLAKTLKLELERSQARVEELLRERESDHYEIDELMKQIMEDKRGRKSKEHERIKAAVQSVRDELEDERRLRRLSEGLHRKLAKESSEVKSAFLKAVKDLGTEKRTRNLLENLCYEFAKGIREYEQEVRELKQKFGKGCDQRCDRLVLHISEAWLDERMQMKLAEARGDLSEKNTIENRLTCEVETFLQARQRNSSNDDGFAQDSVKDTCLRRQSLESVHLNGAVSAPQDVEDEDSREGDLHCFELNMGGNTTERCSTLKLHGVQNIENLGVRKSNATRKTKKSSERFKYESSSISQLCAQSCSGGKIQFMSRVQGIHKHNARDGVKDAAKPQMSEDGESVEDVKGIEGKQDSTHRSSRSNNIIENSISKAEFGQFHNTCPRNDHEYHSLTVGRNNALGDYCSPTCPMQQQSHGHASSDLEISESSSKLPQGVKENTLKAKLLEARLQGRHACLMASRDS